MDDPDKALAGGDARPIHCTSCGEVLPDDSTSALCDGCVVASALAVEAAPPTIFGDYELLGEPMQGGMGVVRRGRQQGLDRTVALKFIKAGTTATLSDRLRFQIEAQALARLRHPNIVEVYETGIREDQPFISMEWMEGGDLRQRLEQAGGAPLPNRRAAEIGGAIARAVDHAHQHGVLHRDLTPRNILFDGDGEPHVGDFSLARMLHAESDLTRTGIGMGSPGFASPEQAVGREVAITSDVYGLGALLHFMLTGAPPFVAKSLEDYAASAARSAAPDPARRNPAVHRDLATICRKSLDPDPGRRYATAGALADDLDRWLGGRPILARPYSPVEKTWNWARRNPAVAGFAAALLISVLAGVAGVTLQWKRAEHSKAAALGTLSELQTWKAERLLSEGNLPKAVQQLVEAMQQSPETPLAASRLLSLLTERSFPIPLAPPFVQEATVHGVEFSADGTLLLTLNTNGPARVWETGGECRLVATLKHERLPIHSATFSPDGRRIVTAGSDGSARIWNARTGEPVTPVLVHSGEVMFAAFSPDNSKLISASLDRTAKIWDARTGALLGAPLPHSDGVLHAQFSEDGRMVLTMSGHGARATGAFLWNLAEPSTPPRRFPHNQDDVPPRFTPDGTKLLTLNVTNGTTSVAIWDIVSGRLVAGLTPHPAAISAMDPALDGERWIVGTADGWVKVLNLPSGVPVVSMLHSPDGVMSARFSRDGQLAVTTALDPWVRIWDPRTGGRVREPIQHDFYGTTAVFSPDGRQLATGSFDGTARLWDVRFRGALNEPLRHAGRINAAVFSPDGERLLTVSDDQTARVWDCASRQPIGRPLVHGAPVIAGRWEREAGRALTLSRNGRLRVWDTRSATALSQLTVHTGAVDYAQFGLDGKSLLLAHGAGVRVWDIKAGQPLKAAIETPRLPHLARISPDGQIIVCVEKVYQNMGENVVTVWDVPTAKLRGRLEHDAPVTAIDFNPDNERLVTASYDDSARVWNLATMQEVAAFRGTAAFNVARFSPDGTKVVSASVDRTASLWESRTGRELVEPMRQSNVVHAAAFSADGSKVAIAGKDRSLIVWDVATGLPLTERLYHPSPARLVEFSPDGRRMVTISDDHAAWVWDVPLPDGPAPSWLGSLARFIAAGTRKESGKTPDELWRNYVAIRSRVMSGAANDFYTRWARWFLSDPGHRTISPWSTMPAADSTSRREQDRAVEKL